MVFMVTIDIHKFKEKAERQRELIKQEKEPTISKNKFKKIHISKRNKELICEGKQNFYTALEDDDIGYGRIDKYMRTLRQIATELKKDFDMLTEEDTKKIIRDIRKQDYSEEGKKFDYKVTLMKFFKWLRSEIGYPKDYPTKELKGRKLRRGDKPDEVYWIKLTKKNNHKLPSEILTEDEIKKLITNAKTPLYKAFVSMLYESGCRVAELLTLQRKSIEFDDIGAKIHVKGKTGERVIRIIFSTPYLTKLYNSQGDNPENPLFPSPNNNKIPLSYTAIRQTLKSIAKKSKITKATNPHAFRHSRATFLANKLTEAQLKEIFGWSQSSRQCATYVHLSGRDTDEALQRVNGIKKPEQEKESKLRAKRCPRCNELNEPTAKYCEKCWLALDVKIAMEEEEIMKGVKESPEFINALAIKYIEKKAPEIIERLIAKRPELLKKALALKK